MTLPQPKQEIQLNQTLSPLGSPLVTIPFSASMVTAVPERSICVALEAPVITGISSVFPTIAAWLSSPRYSVIMPAAVLSSGSIALLVCGITSISPELNSF